MSRPFSVLRSCFVAICVYTPARLNRMHAFSNATVRWLDGIPTNFYCKHVNETKENEKRKK